MIAPIDVRWLINILQSTGHGVVYKEYDEIGHPTYFLLKEDHELYDDIIDFITKSEQ